MKTDAHIVLRALDGDPLVELKALFLGGLGLAATEDSSQCRTVPLAYCEADGSREDGQRRGQLSLGSDLLLAARVLNLDAEESRRIVAAVHHREEPMTSVLGGVVSPRNELAAMDMIRRAAIEESSKLEKPDQHYMLEPLINALNDLGRLAKEENPTVEVQSLSSTEDTSLGMLEKHVVHSVRLWESVANSNTSAVMHLKYGIRVDQGIGCAVASKDINAGDIVLSLSESLLISVHLARRSRFWQSIDDMLDPLSSKLPAATLQTFSDHFDTDVRLLLWTIDQTKGENSVDSSYPPWIQDFWQSLPQEKLNTGLTVADELLEGCGDPVLQAEIQSYRDSVVAQFDSVATALRATDTDFCKKIQDVLTLENYMWAVEIWAAYAVKVVKADKDSSVDDPDRRRTEAMMCLIPGLHWCNHAIWPNAVSFSTIEGDIGSLTLTAVRGVPEGGEFTIGYGALSNRELLKYYGFAIPNNPYDTLQVELELEPDAQQVLTEFGTSHTGILDVSGHIPHDLVATVRILCLEDPMNFLRETDSPTGALNNINIRFPFDADALTMLLDYLHLVQSSIPRLEKSLQIHETAHFYGIYLEGQRSLVEKAISRLDSVLASIMDDKKTETPTDSSQAGDASSVPL